MEIKAISNEAFIKYGRILNNYDTSDLINAMETTPLPEGVVYEPSIEKLEALQIASEIQTSAFGELPIQIGYCNGHNHMLNAVEYHRSSELNLAVTDMVLLLGRQQDIDEDYSYDTKNVEAFLVPAGTLVEVYATTLHYAPCGYDDEGFKCVVVLPKDTNQALEQTVPQVGENPLLFAKNKWLIGHEETDLKEQGAHIGLKGINISIK